jgi:hypothetical protein
VLVAQSEGSRDASERPADYRVGVERLAVGVLEARREVIRLRRRQRRLAQRLAKPAYVNTDASCREGLAGLAYQSGVLGNRMELVVCGDVTRAEHLALLMAMNDAMQVLSGPVVFRVDSTAVADIAHWRSGELDDVRREVRVLLAHHPDWDLVLIERKSNMPAHVLVNRVFKQAGVGPVEGGV